MKLFLIALLVLILGLVAFGAYSFVSKQIHVPDQNDLIATIDKRVNSMFKNQQEHAIVVGLYKEGRSAIRLYGVKSQESESPVDASSVFQIGSISKVFTAYVLQKLVDEGTLSMESTLKELLGSTTTLNNKSANITLHQLVTHTSGLPRIPESLMTLAVERAGEAQVMIDPYTHVSPNEILDYLATADDIKSPGKFDYSNYGMGLLGQVLEQHTGQSLEQLYNEHIFRPLNMLSSGIELTPEAQALLVQGYSSD